MGDMVPGGGTGRCKGPEVGVSLACSRHSRAATVMVAE